MLIYISVFLVVLVLALAYFHGVCAKVITKDSEFTSAIMLFKNVQQPYDKLYKHYRDILQMVKSHPVLKQLMTEAKIKPFGNFYDNPHRVRDQTKLRSSLGVLISQDDYNGLDQSTKDEVDSAFSELENEGALLKKETPNVLTRQCIFPFRSPLSYSIAPVKVYPAFMRDIRNGAVDFKVFQTDAGCLEIYSKNAIDFQFPVGPNRPHFRLTDASKPEEIDSDDEEATDN